MDPKLVRWESVLRERVKEKLIPNHFSTSPNSYPAMGENKDDIKLVLTTSEANKIVAKKKLRAKIRIALVRNLSRGFLRIFKSIKKQANMQPASAAIDPLVTVSDKLKNQ